MLNTFENAERQHLRRLEREKHLDFLNSMTGSESIWQLSLEGDDTGMSPAADALGGEPLAKQAQREDSHSSVFEKQNRARWLRNNRFAIGVTVIAIAILLLAFTLGVDVGEKDIEEDKAPF